MSKKKLLLTFFTLVVILAGLIFIKNIYDEKQLHQCITNVLAKEKVESITASTQNRGKKPILKGAISESQKNKLFAKLYKQCGIKEIQDFVEISNPGKSVHSSLNFQIDHVNNIINIAGIANNQNDIDNVLNSFRTAIVNNMPTSDIPWTLSPDISINKLASQIDFSVTITLLFSAIDNIKLTDILIENNQLTLKGLVRDKVSKNETSKKIEQLFNDEFTIINELEIVIKHQLEKPLIKIDLLPPVIQDPNQN